MRALLPTLGLALVIASGAAHAAGPFGVRMTYAADPATSIAISWNSDDVADNEVHFGTSAAALDATFLVQAADQHSLASPLGTSFSARLTNLQPATKYFYKVGHAGTLYPAEALTFTTVSDDPCATLTFVVIGDNRSDNILSSTEGVSPKYAGILADAAARVPAFFVNTGDMIRDGSKPAQWNDLITSSESVWSKVPSITTQGNHDGTDGEGAVYNQLFELPRNSATSTEDFYSLDIGPVHFATINSNHTADTELAAMASWLDADLAATTQPWKIVFFHKGIYSRGNHHTGEEQDVDGNAGVLNKTFVPIFDARHVDLVLNGHSHDYERFVPSRGVDAVFGGAGRTFPAGDATSLDPTADLPDGATATSYIVTGGGGASTTDIPLLDINCPDGSCSLCTGTNRFCDQTVFDTDQQASVVFEGTQHFVSISVTAGRLSAEVIETSGDGSGPIGTLDAFQMQKPSFPGCTAGEGEGEGSAGEGEGEGQGGEGEGQGGEGEGASAGEGEGEGEGGGPSSCGCGAVTGVAPLGVALIFVARRRRSR